MKTMQKVLAILLIAVCVFGVVSQLSTCHATDVGGYINNIDPSKEEVKDAGNLTKIASRILTFLQIASGIAAVIMIAVTGFRYIIETPEVKGELKKNMLPIVIGLVLVFFATSIAKFIIGMFSNVKA